MTERQYSLPNCRLVLQGLNNDGDMSTRPLLSVVTNVECYLAGQKTPISGGREFLEGLTTSVSQYAQSYLSGIQDLVRPGRHQQTGLVQLQQVSQNLHRLTVQPTGQAGAATEINLTTVQLFDLVEAVDQFFADAQTLPDLALKLNPLSKRHVAAAEPIAKRAAPAAIGLSSLAAAAAVLFMLPVPQVRRPEAVSQSAGAATDTATTATPTTGASPTNTSDQTSDPASDQASTSPTPTTGASASGAAVSAGGSTGANGQSSSSSSSSTSQTAGLDLTRAPEITDSAELDRLTVELYDKLDLGWKKKPTFDGELIYRVGVNQKGDIVGYKYGNDAALTYLNDTPLADVQFDTPSAPVPDATVSPGKATDEASGAATSATAGTTTGNPLAQFRVVFKSDGVLEVSPWSGQPGEQSGTESTGTDSGTESTNTAPASP